MGFKKVRQLSNFTPRHATPRHATPRHATPREKGVRRAHGRSRVSDL